MAARYSVKDRRLIDAKGAVDADGPVAEVLASAELDTVKGLDDTARISLKALAAANSTYVDVRPSYYAGSVVLPAKGMADNSWGAGTFSASFAFYLGPRHLVILDDGDVSSSLKVAATGSVVDSPSAASTLFELLAGLIDGDFEYLASLEATMADEEALIVDKHGRTDQRRLLDFRREVLGLDTFYRQLLDVATSLADNENDVLDSRETSFFADLSSQARRLLEYSGSLKDYSLHLRDLYQTQLEVQQNRTMQFFTVITTVFAVPTLLASWYGMNFKNIPGMNTDWGYWAVFAAAALVTVVLLVYFRKKDWI